MTDWQDLDLTDLGAGLQDLTDLTAGLPDLTDLAFFDWPELTAGLPVAAKAGRRKRARHPAAQGQTGNPYDWD